MDDNAIVYLLSFVGVVLIFIEWLRISRKRSILSMIIFLSYSAPLYYLMIFKGHGGAAFTWWFYLVLFTSIHVIILLLRFLRFFFKRYL